MGGAEVTLGTMLLPLLVIAIAAIIVAVRYHAHRSSLQRHRHAAVDEQDRPAQDRDVEQQDDRRPR